jgi:hypothetical protein
MVVGTTLTLRDQESQEVVGSLVVLYGLTDLTTQAGADSVSHDVGQKPSTSSPISEPATTSAAMLDSVAREAPYPSHQHITEVDLIIRALTTVLSILDSQASSPTKGPSSIEFKVAMHIATLLTRGADQKRGRMGPNIRPIAVATRTTADSVNILAAIDEDDYSNGLSNHFVVTQKNPTSNGPNAFSATEIESIDLNDVQRGKLLSRYISSPFYALP